MKKKHMQKYILIFVMLALCMSLTYHSALYSDIRPIYSLFTSTTSVLAIAGTFYLLYAITRDTMKDARQEAELLALEQQEKLQKEQSETLAGRRRQTLALQQDMQQKLNVYEELMEHKEYEKAASCLDALTDSFQQERFHPVCNNNLINAILNSKRQIAEQHGIRTNFQLLLPEKMNIENSDLSSIFFNLMDNGIESCLKSGADKPFIQITAKQSANFLAIHMVNSKDPSQKFNHKTNKTDSWSHGFGLAIIEDIADRYDGTCQWIDDGERFESVVMVGVG
nr:sensor histidine kinase [uncultured Blautia sp.]